MDGEICGKQENVLLKDRVYRQNASQYAIIQLVAASPHDITAGTNLAQTRTQIAPTPIQASGKSQISRAPAPRW